VIAVGTGQIVPDVPGSDKAHFVSAIDVLCDISQYKGSRAVVIGGGDVGCETACHLADNGFTTTIVEMLPELMKEELPNMKVQMFTLIEEKNITVMTNTKLHAVTDDGVEVALPNGKIGGLDADVVAYAVGFIKEETSYAENTTMNLLKFPLRVLIGEMAMKADEVHLIGDCDTLGRIREATEAGERIGRRL